MENLKEIFTISMYMCGIVFFITLTASFIQSFVTSIEKQRIKNQQVESLQKFFNDLEKELEKTKEKD